MLHIIYEPSSVWDYLIEGLKDNSNVYIRKLESPSLILLRIIRRCLRLFNIYPVVLYYDLKQLKLKNIQANDRVLFINIDVNNYDVLNYIIKHISGEVKLFCWLPNPCRKSFGKERNVATALYGLTRLNNMRINCTTFDMFDSQFFNLPLLRQVYRYPRKLQISYFEYDFYFLGLPKDRKDRIMDIQNKLLGYCFSVNFSIIEKDTKVLSYEENISNILKSKCIVDIVQKEQTGLTLRPLEALFFERKLLTDYKDIVKYDFYKPQNIFVIGIHDWTDIRSFLSSPFIPVNKKIVDNYNINKWINYFLEE